MTSDPEPALAWPHYLVAAGSALLALGLLARSPPSPATPRAADTAGALTVVVTDSGRHGDVYRVRGRVTNGSARPFVFWKAITRLLDARGQPIDVVTTESHEPLGAGQSLPFENRHRYDPRIAGFSASAEGRYAEP